MVSALKRLCNFEICRTFSYCCRVVIIIKFIAKKKNEKLIFCTVRDVRIAHFQSFNSLALVLSPKYQNCTRDRTVSGVSDIKSYQWNLEWSEVVKSRIFLTCEIQAKHADYHHHTVIFNLTFLTSYDGRVFSEEKMDKKHQLLLNKSISPYLF